MTNPFETIDARLSNIENLLIDLKHRQPATPTPPPATTPERIRLNGDKSCSKHLGCSVMTVQSLRRSGAIPYGRTGRKIFYFSDLVDEALSVKARKFNRKPTEV